MCIGANKHKKMSEALELTWQRVSPTSFVAAMKRNGLKTEEEQAEDIIRSHVEIQGLVDLTLSASCESSDQVAREYDSVAKDLREVPLVEYDRKLVDGVLKRNLYTGYGNMHERRVLEYIRDTLSIDCRTDPTFYKCQQGTCTGDWGTMAWYVGGKIDAIGKEHPTDPGYNLLIEVKNRVNRLFRNIPFYEMVQVQTYLHLLNLEKGVLVECLKTSQPTHPSTQSTSDAGACDPPPPNASTPMGASTGGAREVGAPDVEDMSVNVITVHRDSELWEREIVPKLQGFVDFLARLLNDPALQDRYLQSKRRSAMITAHVNSCIRFSR
jgi:hypothetical protein